MTKKIKDLNPAEYNPRKISDKQLELLNKSMKEYGDLSGIVFNVATGNIIGGHQRTKLLNPEAIIQKEDCQDETGTTAIGYVITSEGKFSYREVNWTEQKEKAANIAANKGGGEWDFTKLKDLMEDLDDGQFDLELTGFDTQEIKNLMTFVPEDEPEVLESKEDDFNAEPPKTPITVLGDLYELNNHRLHCADSTDITAVEKLMNGKKADMVFTDPPYGVDYDGGQESMYNNHGKQTNVKREKLANDLSVNIYQNFIPLLKLFTSNIFYMFYGAGTEPEFYNAIKDNNIELINTLIWNKPKGSGALGANYKPCYESFIYGKIPKGQRLWSGKHDQWTVFDSSKDKCKDHPTQKPIKLIIDLLLNHIAKLIADPFLGSGTTLIASEELNRICYGQELSPNYCDVIVKRYVTYMRKENKPYTIKRNSVILSEDDINKYFEN